MTTYPKDTIGYHYTMAKAFFGADSKPVKWLEKKAAESPTGFEERVIMHETQMVYVLGTMFLEEQKEKNLKGDKR